MPNYDLIPKTYDSTNINASIYQSWFVRGEDAWSTPRVVPVSVSPVGGYDRYARSQPQGKSYPLHIRLVPGVLTEANLGLLKKLFDPYKGMKTLVLTDGDGVDRRVTVKSRGLIEYAGPGFFTADLWAFDPLMYADAATVLATTIDADSKNVVLVNAGDTRTSNITLDLICPAPKESELYKFRWARQVIVLNRSTKAATNWPHELTNGGWDTASLIKDTGINTTVNGAVTAAQTTIPLVSAAGLSLSGIVYVVNGGTNDEQISYNGITANVLQNCTRGIGGTVGFAHSGGQTVNRSRMLRSGDDVRVYVDGIEVDRSLGLGSAAINTAATSLWVDLDIQPETLPATVANAMTAASPANAGTLTVTTGQSTAGFPNVGAICIDNEVITYTGRIATGFTGITRGARNTTAAAHAAAATIYHVQHSIIVCYGWAGADAPPSALTKTPAFSLASADSSNTQYKWKAFGAITSDGGVARPGFWVPSLTADDPLSAYTSLTVSSAVIQFKDALPAANAPNANSMSVNLPYPIDNVAAEITHDINQNPVLSVNCYGRDADGNEALLKSYLGSSNLAAQTLDSVGTLYGLRYTALHTAVVGGDTADSLDSALVSGPDSTMGNTFTIDKATKVTAVAVRLKKQVAGDTYDYAVQIRAYGTTQPDGPIMAVSPVIANSELTHTAYTTVIKTFTVPPILAAGVYHIGIVMNSGAGYGAFVSAISGGYSRGDQWGYIYGAWTKDASRDTWFRVYGQDPATGFPMPQFDAIYNSGGAVSIDNLIIKLQASTAPLVLFQAAQDAVFLSDTLTNPSTGQVLTFAGPFPLPIQVAAGFRTLHLDCASGLITITETGELAGYLVTSTDNVGFFSIDPGTNTCVYASTGFGTTATKPTLTATYRSAWT